MTDIYLKHVGLREIYPCDSATHLRYIPSNPIIQYAPHKSISYKTILILSWGVIQFTGEVGFCMNKSFIERHFYRYKGARVRNYVSEGLI